MSEYDALIAEDDVTPLYEDVPLCLRGDLVERVASLKAELSKAIVADMRDGGVKTIADKVKVDLEAAEAELLGHQTIVRVAGIPEHEWRELKVKHPPGKEGRALGVDFNPESFPPAAVAASVLQVEHHGKTATGHPPVAWVRDLRDNKLTAGQWDQLWQTTCNMNLGVLDLGKLVGGTGSLPSSGTNSTTAAPEASPEASS